MAPRTAHAKFCNTHYFRVYRRGSTSLKTVPRSHRHSQGYVILNARDHPLARNGGVYEHRAALFAKIGPGTHPCHWCALPLSWEKTYPKDRDGLAVDHLDENKANNAPQNLVPSCGRCNLARTLPGNRHARKRPKVKA